MAFRSIPAGLQFQPFFFFTMIAMKNLSIDDLCSIFFFFFVWFSFILSKIFSLWVAHVHSRKISQSIAIAANSGPVILLLNCLARLYLSHVSRRILCPIYSAFLELSTDQHFVQIGFRRFILSLSGRRTSSMQSMFCFRVIS